MEPFTEGVFEDMPIGEYHASPALSNSGIKHLLKSPAHYKAYLAGDSDSKALRVGRMFHTLALEPHLAEDWEPIESLRPKRDRDERAIAEACAKAVRDSALTKRIGFLDPARAKFEVSMYCNVKTDEGPCWVRCRMDSWLPILPETENGGLIFDLKSTDTATRDNFALSVGKFGYHIQAALYIHVARTLGFNVVDDGMLFPVVEKAPPHGVGIFALDDQAIEQGHRDFMRAATIWAKCYRTGEWPSYEEKVQTVSLKPWLIDAEVAQ